MEQPKVETSDTGVNFAYTFATPHRLTVCLPNASEKTILDVAEDKIRMAWSNECMKNFPLASYTAPIVNWELNLYPKANGQVATGGRWQRVENHIPALIREYELPNAKARLEMVGAATAAIGRITMTNTAAQTQRLSMIVEGPGVLMKGYNPATVEEYENADALLAGWYARSDRVLAFVLGAEKCLMPNDAGIEMAWDVPAGGTCSG